MEAFSYFNIDRLGIYRTAIFSGTLQCFEGTLNFGKREVEIKHLFPNNLKMDATYGKKEPIRNNCRPSGGIVRKLHFQRVGGEYNIYKNLRFRKVL